MWKHYFNEKKNNKTGKKVVKEKITSLKNS